ncbi:MAG: hypothetical protein M5U19_20485 [Microthrixaceae bacterium]|nr:hypothetical protein [Microthrixaceae bacterium]
MKVVSPGDAPDALSEVMVPSAYRVLRRRVDIAGDPTSGIDEVVTLELEPIDAALGEPSPGQFMMVWAPGVGGGPGVGVGVRARGFPCS